MLSVKNLAVGYSHQLFPELSFELNSGEILFLVGANGSGKSALLKTLSGGLKPLYGKIHIQKTPALIHSNFEIQTGLTAQDLFDLFEVNSSPWYNQDLLSHFQVSPLLDKPFEWLSSGERQRILLCAGLFYKSDLVLFDEPLSYLDWNFYFMFSDALKYYANKGRSFVIANHDLNFSLQFHKSTTLLLISSNELLYADTEKVLNDKRLENLFNVNIDILEKDFKKTLLFQNKQQNKIP